MKTRLAFPALALALLGSAWPIASRAGGGHEAHPPAPPPPRIVAPAEARATPQSLIRAEDYPDSSLSMGEEGRVRFVLDVGADGRVHGCTVTRSSGARDLDSVTCRIMRSRARFTPARDNQGNPAPSRVEQQVSWALPADAPPKFKQWGHGMATHSVSAPAVNVTHGLPIINEPIMAIPQSGPGEAELIVWTPGSDKIPTLGRYPSIPDCRQAMTRLRLTGGQKAYCTIAPTNEPRSGW